MNKQEAEAFIAAIESSNEYIFYRDVYLTIEKAKRRLNSSTIPSLNDTISANSQEIRPKWLKPNEVFGWRGYFDVRGFERMYGDVFDSEEECVARTPTATGYQKVVIELPEDEMENDDE